jgi:hypothetical protein
VRRRSRCGGICSTCCCDINLFQCSSAARGPSPPRPPTSPLSTPTPSDASRACIVACGASHATRWPYCVQPCCSWCCVLPFDDAAAALPRVAVRSHSRRVLQHRSRCAGAFDGPRVYGNFAVFRESAVFQVKPVPPRFKASTTGSLSLSKPVRSCSPLDRVWVVEGRPRPPDHRSRCADDARCDCVCWWRRACVWCRVLSCSSSPARFRRGAPTRVASRTTTGRTNWCAAARSPRHCVATAE